MGQDRPILSRSAAQLRARAKDFQQLARAARSIAAVGALLRLADRYEALAESREQEDAGVIALRH